MEHRGSSLATWSPAQILLGRRWVAIWQRAGESLDAIRRKELRDLDTYHAVSLLCGPMSGELRPSSGLVEQQRWFMRAARHR